ncbi:MAG: hypothetical protein MJ166_07625 [Clostridia bacterium]|nr:hypothetical protein [Clostridia bacterium]
MKKKWLALLLASTMLLSVACSDKKEDKKDDDKDDKKVEEVEETEKKSKDDKDADADVEETTGATEAAPKGTPIDTTYWSAVIPDSYTYDEENFSDSESWGKHEFTNYDAAADEELGSLVVYADECGTYEFRKDLARSLDLHDIQDGKVDTMTIDGEEFLVYETEYWGETITHYYHRAESTGISLYIEVTGDMPEVDAFISSMTLSLPDNGNVDAPYPWDGEQMITSTSTAQFGDYSVTAVQLVADVSNLPWDLFDNRVAVVGDLLYALDEEELTIYTIDGDTLKIDTVIELEADYTHMCQDNNGNVYVSRFGSPLLVLNNKEIVNVYDDIKDQVAMAPDGSFGISYFMDEEGLEKVTLNDDGTATIEPFALVDVAKISSVSEINMSANHIIISGTSKDDEGNDGDHLITVFDYNGNFQYRLCGDPEGFLEGGMGHITATVETNDYFLALDGNMREILMWSKDGSWLGTVKDENLFGTNYPWLCGLCEANGSVYVSLVEDRPDDSWQEMVFYRLDVTK